MMRTDMKTAEPSADVTFDCPECGHGAVGYRDPMDRLFSLFGRAPRIHCATHDRLGPLQDAVFCECRHVAHHAQVVSDLLDAPEVDRL